MFRLSKNVALSDSTLNDIMSTMFEQYIQQMEGHELDFNYGNNASLHTVILDKTILRIRTYGIQEIKNKNSVPILLTDKELISLSVLLEKQFMKILTTFVTQVSVLRNGIKTKKWSW